MKKNLHSRNKRKGAVLVEAAAATLFLVLPLLLGIIQFGLFYGASNGLTQVAREGARYAAVYGLRSDGTPASDKFIRDHMQEVGRQSNVVVDSANITISPARNLRSQYTPVVVTVTYDMNQKRIMPFFNPGTVSRTTTSMLE